MIYSKWIPDRGGYAYYETSERRGLGDDLPIPRLHAASPLGVASTDIGRPMPLGAKIVGYGPLAKGSIAPLDRSGLMGAELLPGATAGWALIALGAASAIGAFFLVRRVG